MNNLESAIVTAAFVGGAPARTYEVGPQADIKLADGTGHLLTDATITAWELPDVVAGRNE
ncbi:hypothetical protein [Mycolicibacterium neoaurum]|uniref:hypothetical protein n=1 Tax=Mycolicibacterium neoaurum TaxID=1795 RepID=UPI001F4C70C5|nr:hypothetical protein [Mycolicibacterium neoaurum]